MVSTYLRSISASPSRFRRIWSVWHPEQLLDNQKENDELDKYHLYGLYYHNLMLDNWLHQF